jgi:hypothetical protein
VGVFKAVITCEDVRDEVGNKKSLIGVFSGDITVPSFPAMVRVAFYLEYAPDKNENEVVNFVFRLLLDDVELGKGTGILPIVGAQIGIIGIPQAFLALEKETRIRMLISINGGAEEEVVSKRVFQGTVTSSTIAPAHP